VELAGTTAIVTGAGRGIGRAIAFRLAAERAAVVLADTDEQAGAATAAELQRGGAAVSFQRVDVTDAGDVEHLVGHAEEAFGGLDLLVNNVGNYEQPVFPDASVAHWTRNLDVNLRSAMLAIHFAVPAMRRRGGGAIVSIASTAGLGTAPHPGPEYSAAKAALMRLTATLAPLGLRGIRVNCVCPDWVGTDAVRKRIAAMTTEERAAVPEVIVEPEEVADAVVGLARDETLRGRVVVLFGGRPPRLLPVEAAETTAWGKRA
jgi:NAD(P)-dependent dehydrogenase (short-subunit alcohol dehydrogenase family)